MSAQNQGALMDVDEAQIDEGLYSRQLQVSSSMPCHFAHRVLSSLLDMYWAMKVCNMIWVEEVYQRETGSHETYGRFQRSDRRVRRSWSRDRCAYGYRFIWGDSNQVNLAKNVILAGVKSVTVYDPELVQIQDLSSQASTRLF